jgi:hypothetical protein
MIDFKIEKGKFYLTRAGKKAECVAVLSDKAFPFIFVTNICFGHYH